MKMNTLSESLNKLRELELLTQEQLDQLKRIPQDEATLAGKSAGEILGWLVAKELLDEDVLLEGWDDNIESFTEERLQQREETIDIAWETMLEIRQELNLEQLAVLRDELILSAAQYERLKVQVSWDEVIDTPAGVLVDLLVGGHLSEQEWQAMLAEMEKDRQFASSSARVNILTEAKQKFEEHRVAEDLLARKKFLNSMTPGAGTWLVLIVFALVATPVYLAQRPKPVPMCDAPDIVSSVNSTLMSSKWNVQPSSAYELINMPKGVPRLLEPQQAGYLSEEKVRGCVGVVNWQERKYPYGYTIKPDSVNSGKFEVAGVYAGMIKARFGSIDEQGHSTNLAAPVGRRELQAAIRTGVENLPPNESQNRMLHQLNLMMYSGRRPVLDPNRKESEVIDLEPLGNCQPIPQSKMYQCDVLLLINDRVLEALRRRSVQTIKSTFKLAPREDGHGWAVTEDFNSAYAKALAEVRQASMPKAGETRTSSDKLNVGK